MRTKTRSFSNQISRPFIILWKRCWALTPAEKPLFVALFCDHCEGLAPVLAEQKWRWFPGMPPMAIMIVKYSGEMIASDNEDEKWFEEMKQ
jgi:hypothetical protein